MTIATTQDSLQAKDYRNTTHATMVGIGAVRQLDTYLSPLNYTGPQLQVMHETMRFTRMGQGRVSVQSMWQGDLSMTHNQPNKGNFIGGNIRYDIGWHYNWNFPSFASAAEYEGKNTSKFRVLLGPQIGANIGFLYSTRNGNNPSQALASLHISASAAAIYNFKLWRQPIAARYQLDIPLIGLKFSPAYGQSYYEIFTEGRTDHNICFVHPFNAFTSRHLLTIDIPFQRATLRVGYLCDIRQSEVNELKYHAYTHAFMIGWVRHLRYVRTRRTQLKGFAM